MKYCFIVVGTLLFLTGCGDSAKAQPKGMVGGDKVCKCLSHGPKGGCLRWQCRRQYHRVYHGGPHGDDSTKGQGG
jgi:hypothetical protein